MKNFYIECTYQKRGDRFEQKQIIFRIGNNDIKKDHDGWVLINSKIVDKPSYACSLCNTDVGSDNSINIVYTGGYESAYFGDMNHVDFIMCENCLKDLVLKHNIKIIKK
ncbi:MAG: hypothetical protein KKD48_01930 [Nanoarchaeota archaeon]|nr:hypothetical protein [Nanoarchaeota archaeon]